MESKNELLRRDVNGMAKLLLPFALVGVVAMLAQAWSCERRIYAFSVSLAVAVAAVGVGALLGFIFGVPRVFRGADKPATQAEQNSGSTPLAAIDSGAQPSRGYVGNSNLEEISDWLAKLLIGAGFAEMKTLVGYVGELARVVAREFGAEAGPAYASALIVTYLVLGFFLSYLFARRVLPLIFLRADADGSGLSPTEKQDVQTAMQLVMNGGNLDLVKAVFGERVRRIADLPRAAIGPHDGGTWAKARFITRDFDAAAQELASLSTRSPENAHLGELSVFSSLYVDPPEGFRKAIQLGEETSKKTPMMHVYLAAAWGQAHDWYQKNENTRGQAAIDEARRKVIEHVGTALTGDPSLKQLMAAMWRPATDATDRDLESLKDDAELQKLLT
jgi:hypothetical protein